MHANELKEKILIVLRDSVLANALNNSHKKIVSIFLNQISGMQPFILNYETSLILNEVLNMEILDNKQD